MASPENLAVFFELSNEYAIQNDARIRQIIEEQRRREANIIDETNSFCPLAQIQDLTATSEDVGRAMKEGFGDANILKSIMCLNNSLAVFPPNPDGLGRSMKVRQYLHDLRQIGGESAEGYAMTAEVDSAHSRNQRPFVVKSPRQTDPDAISNLLHEYFVGAFGTNMLRNQIPNFAYILGFFQCAPPYLESWPYVSGGALTPQSLKDRRALTYCQNDAGGNQVVYVLYENVTDAVTLRQFILDGCSFEDYLNVLVQVIMAEQVAYTEIDYTHYDLHDENVLIKKLPEEIYIQYPGGYLRTRYLAMIIDEGRAHIQYEQRNYGYALVQGGIYPDRSYPMYDIYKLLMFSLMTAAFGQRDMRAYANFGDDELEARGLLSNPAVFQNAKEMLRFFYPDIDRNRFNQRVNNSADYLIKTRRFYYSLPYSSKYDLPPIDFFQRVVQPLAQPIVAQFMTAQPPTDPNRIYGCAQKGICLTLQQALSVYTEPDARFLDDPYIFYESLFEAIEKGGVESERIFSEGQELYEIQMDRLWSDARRYRTEYEQIVQALTPIRLTSYQPAFLDLYRHHVARVIRAADLMTSLTTIDKIMRFLNDLYPQRAQRPVSANSGLNHSYADIPRLELEPILRTIPHLNGWIQGLREDVESLRRVNPNQLLAVNPEARWLFEKLPSIPAAVSYL